MKASRLFLAIASFTLLFHCVPAQDDLEEAKQPGRPKSEKTYLVDEFGHLGDCDLRARLDSFLQELHQAPPGWQGYMIFYKGANVLPGQYDSASHHRVFLNHIAFRNFDSKRFTVVDGGFKEEMRTQMWLIPPGGETPLADGSIEPPTIPVDKTFLFDRREILSYASLTETFEFELPLVGARRAAEQASAEAENRQEIASQESTASDTTSEQDSGQTSDKDGAVEDEEFVDTRTPEEIDAQRFEWASDQFAQLLAERNKSTGRIIYYADDQTYDINRLQQFVEQGRKRIADAAQIPASRISIEFGGYRGTVEAEFWVIPKNRAAPTATPEERPVEESEEPGN